MAFTAIEISKSMSKSGKNSPSRATFYHRPEESPHKILSMASKILDICLKFVFFTEKHKAEYKNIIQKLGISSGDPLKISQSKALKKVDVDLFYEDFRQAQVRKF